MSGYVDIAGLLFSDHGGIINRTFSDAEMWRLRGEFIDALARDAAQRSPWNDVSNTALALCAHLDAEGES